MKSFGRFHSINAIWSFIVFFVIVWLVVSSVLYAFAKNWDSFQTKAFYQMFSFEEKSFLQTDCHFTNSTPYYYYYYYYSSICFGIFHHCPFWSVWSIFDKWKIVEIKKRQMNQRALLGANTFILVEDVQQIDILQLL